VLVTKVEVSCTDYFDDAAEFVVAFADFALQMTLQS